MMSSGSSRGASPDPLVVAATRAGRFIGLGLALVGLAIFSVGSAWLAATFAVGWQLPTAATLAALVGIGLAFDVIEPVAGTSGRIDLAQGVDRDDPEEGVVGEDTQSVKDENLSSEAILRALMAEPSRTTGPGHIDPILRAGSLYGGGVPEGFPGIITPNILGGYMAQPGGSEAYRRILERLLEEERRKIEGSRAEG